MSYVGFKIALRKWIRSVALKAIVTKSISLEMHYMFDKVNDMVELLIIIDKKELVFFWQDNVMITFDVVSTTHTTKDVPIVWKGRYWESFLNMLLNAKVISRVMVCLCDQELFRFLFMTIMKSTSKVHYYIFGVYMLHLFYTCLFLQVDNLNLATNLKTYCFYAMLIACKCKPFCKKIGLWRKKWTTLPCNDPTSKALVLLLNLVRESILYYM